MIGKGGAEFVAGAPERIRTSDLPLRRGPRYPAVPPGQCLADKKREFIIILVGFECGAGFYLIHLFAQQAFFA